jgi:SagB-type dehydrogenase family enzyme
MIKERYRLSKCVNSVSETGDIFSQFLPGFQTGEVEAEFLKKLNSFSTFSTWPKTVSEFMNDIKRKGFIDSLFYQEEELLFTVLNDSVEIKSESITSQKIIKDNLYIQLKKNEFVVTSVHNDFSLAINIKYLENISSFIADEKVMDKDFHYPKLYFYLIQLSQFKKNTKNKIFHKYINNLDFLYHNYCNRKATNTGTTYHNMYKLPPIKAIEPKPTSKPVIVLTQAQNRNITSRSSTSRSFSKDCIVKEKLSNFLSKSLLNKTKMYPYPSAGNIYAMDCYYLTSGKADIPAGLYLYDQLNHNLTLQSPHNSFHKEYFERACTANENVSDSLFVVCNLYKISYKYENAAYKLALLEAGTILQSFYEQASRCSIGLCPIGISESDFIEQKVLNITDYSKLLMLEIHIGDKA